MTRGAGFLARPRGRMSRGRGLESPRHADPALYAEYPRTLSITRRAVSASGTPVTL